MSPRYTYSRSSSTVELPIRLTLTPIALSPISSTTVTTSYGASGSFGAQYELGKRFGVFGELGLSYTHSGDRSTSPTSPLRFDIGGGDLKSWTLGMRSGAGVILFFGK